MPIPIALDLRAALRSLGRDRGFSGTTITVLAVAIAASTALFSAVDQVVLQPPAYADPSRLFSLGAENPDRGWTKEYIAPANLYDYREQVDAIDDIAAFGDDSWDQVATGQGDPQVLSVGAATGNLFTVLGVTPFLGRGFRDEETWADADPVVVLSHGLWLRRYGGDPSVIGHSLILDGVAYTIIGVMPRGFEALGRGHELWRTFHWTRSAREQTWFRRAHLVRAVARLRSGVSPKEAESQVRSVAARLAQSYPGTNRGLSASLTPLQDFLVGDRETPLFLLLGAAALLLLLAAVNVGTVVLVRWAKRRRDLAVRAALGAQPRRLITQLLGECALIATAGAVLGTVAGMVLLRPLLALAPPDQLPLDGVRLDGRFLVFAVLATGLSAVVLGLGPALQSTRVAPLDALREGGGRGGSHTSRGVIRWLVAVEVGLAVVLVVGAGLLGRSLGRLNAEDPGFDPNGVLAFTVPQPDESDEAAPARVRFAADFLARVRRLPGVVSAGATRALPTEGTGWTGDLSIEGVEDLPGLLEVVHRETESGYFGTMRVPLVAGRLFDDGDDAQSPPVVMINEALAAWFPGDPIGRRVANTKAPTPGTEWWTVIGVVGNERQRSLAEAPRPELFVSYRQDTPGRLRYVVRTAGDPRTLVDPIRTVLRAVDPALPLDQVETMTSVTRASLWREHFLFAVTSSFGLFASILAAMGVYGVAAQLSQSRVREFGIRVALGAAPRAMMGEVLRGALGMVAAGLGFGLVGALVVTRVLAGVLYGVSPTDPTTYLAISVVLAAIALGAVLGPALRATRVDPVRALRAE